MSSNLSEFLKKFERPEEDYIPEENKRDNDIPEVKNTEETTPPVKKLNNLKLNIDLLKTEEPKPEVNVKEAKPEEVKIENNEPEPEKIPVVKNETPIVKDDKIIVNTIEKLEDEERRLFLLSGTDASKYEAWKDIYEKGKKSLKSTETVRKIKRGRFRIKKDGGLEILPDLNFGGMSMKKLFNTKWF